MSRKPNRCLSILGGLLLAVAPLAGRAEEKPAPVRVLLLSGANNHDWKTTTPALKKALEESGRFTIDLTYDPAAVRAEDFAKYDVIVSDWTSWPDTQKRIWNEATEKAFVDFIRGGKGLAVFHAASTAFQTWPEYQQMVGSTWALGATGHGRIHTFKVTITDRNHPVTRGMTDFMIRDELWHKTGKQPDARVLCKAFSAKDTGGSGDSEPVALWTRFGKGRCFNLVLGHDVEAIQNSGWRTLMTRGTEWAATGKVTLPILTDASVAVPTAAAVDTTPVDVDADLQAIAKYQFGQKRVVLLRFEKAALAASTQPALRAELRKKVIATLGGDTTMDGKKFLVRQLGLIGTAEDVPVLAGLLADKDLSMDARSALQWMPGDEALTAIRQAIAGAQGPLRVGLINTLGERRDAGGVEVIAKSLGDADPVVAGAAVDARGKIGGDSALKALSAMPATLPTPVQAVRWDALLRCAEGLKRSGEDARANELFQSLSLPDKPQQVRKAAFKNLLARDDAESRGLLLKALAGEDGVLRSAAAEYLTPATAGEDAVRAVKAYAAALAGAKSPDVRKDLLKHLGGIRHAAAVGLCLQYVTDPALGDEAGSAVVRICGTGAVSPSDAQSALRKVLAECRSHIVRTHAMVALLRIDRPTNLAIGATATSPDNLDKDGDSHGDQAAIDGKPETYWDEVDNQKLYVLKVTFKQPTDVSAIDILGYQHHNYAPKDFEIVCDDKVVKKVENAVYLDNEVIIAFPRTRCTSLELRITGYYGQSPAIRELRIYDTNALGQ